VAFSADYADYADFDTEELGAGVNPERRTPGGAATPRQASSEGGVQ
jgi:hypothetical protein